MFDTTVTIVGNALNAPELRRTNSTNTLVASFRVASTSRRYDKDSGRWVDGPSLRVRVTCWRRLAEGVKKCVVTGDPLVVSGRMYTRDWIGDDGQHRVSYELEAFAVGHDLSRGFSDFTRHRPVGATTMVEDAESDSRVGGEASVPVGPGYVSPTGLPEFADTDADDDAESESAEVAEDAMNVLHAVGLGGEPVGSEDESGRIPVPA